MGAGAVMGPPGERTGWMGQVEDLIAWRCPWCGAFVSLSVRSAKFATLSGLQQANVQLLGNPSEQLPQAEVDDLKAIAVDYWTRLTSLVAPWQAILDGDTKPPEARQLYVSWLRRGPASAVCSSAAMTLIYAPAI